MQWLKSFLGTKKQPTQNAVPISPVLDYEVPRYPPFMKGLPVVEPDRLLAQHPELLAQFKRSVNALPEQYERYYLGALRRFAAFAHLLPASQSHHHRGAGGLLRHSMEVALWSLQGADNMLLQMGKTPAARRAIEPKWQLTAFLAGLCHDVGKPATDITVSDSERSVTWKPLAEDLHTWAARNRLSNYFIDWRNGRGKQHVSLSNILSERIIGTDALQWIDEGGTELVVWLMEALNGSPGATNPLYDLVIRADSSSVDRDLKTMGVAMAGYEIGVPIERHLMDIMRRLIKEGIWQINEPGARVWNINGGIYLVWPGAGDELTDKIRIEDIKGMPRTADGLLDMLRERGLAFVRDGHDRYWKIVPDVLAAKIPNKYLTCIRLRDDAILSSTPIPMVPGKLINADENEEDGVDAQGQGQGSAAPATATGNQGTTTQEPDSSTQEGQISQRLDAQAGVEASAHERTESTSGSPDTQGPALNAQTQVNEEEGARQPAKAKLTVDPETGEILAVEAANPEAKKQPQIRELPKSHERSPSVQGISKPVALKIKTHATDGALTAETDEAGSASSLDASTDSSAADDGGNGTSKPKKKKRKKGGYREKPELEFTGSMGELMLALADDLQTGAKSWGGDVLVDEQETVLLRWPACFANYGLTAKTILEECTKNEWIWIDQDNPSVKLVDAKFHGEECKALKLMPDAGDALLYYAKYSEGNSSKPPLKSPSIESQVVDQKAEPVVTDDKTISPSLLPVADTPQINSLEILSTPVQPRSQEAKVEPKKSPILSSEHGKKSDGGADLNQAPAVRGKKQEKPKDQIPSPPNSKRNTGDQGTLSLNALIEVFNRCPIVREVDGVGMIDRNHFRDAALKAGASNFSRKQLNMFIEANSKIFKVDGLYIHCDKAALAKISAKQ